MLCWPQVEELWIMKKLEESILEEKYLGFSFNVYLIQ